MHTMITRWKGVGLLVGIVLGFAATAWGGAPTGTRVGQFIEFPAMGDVVVTGRVALSAAASSGLEVAFRVEAGPGILANDRELAFTAPGWVTVVASQPGNDDYLPAPEVTNQVRVLGVYTITVESAHGQLTPSSDRRVFVEGECMTGSVTPCVTDGATRYAVMGWHLTGHAANNRKGAQVSVVVTNHGTLTWLWATQYWVEASCSQGGSLDIASGWYEAGEPVTVTAQPDPYFAFAGWCAAIPEKTRTAVLPMTAPATFSATFQPVMTTNHPTPQWWLAEYGLTNDVEAVVAEDADGDGLANWQEYVAGTSPDDPDAVLACADISPVFGEPLWTVVWTNDLPPFEVMTNTAFRPVGQVLRWCVATNRVYDLESISLAGDAAWSPVAGMCDLAPSASSLSYTNAESGAEVRLFRLRVRLPDSLP